MADTHRQETSRCEGTRLLPWAARRKVLRVDLMQKARL
jgi:hypothetical protein